MPEGAVYVGRPGLFGNRFRISDQMTCDLSVAAFREWINAPNQAKLRAEAVHFLRGKDLACWCRLDRACHADVLLEIANA